MQNPTTNAAEWWSSTVGPPPTATSIGHRSTARALGNALQLRVRASVLAHRDAGSIFTVVHGGTASDRRRAAEPTAPMASRALALWAEAAALIDPQDPLRRLTVAHAQILCGNPSGAVTTLRDALLRFSDRGARFALWQNLGLAHAFSGDAELALAAYRQALDAPGHVDREVAAISVCIVGAKLKREQVVRDAASVLVEVARDQAGPRALAAIRARRGRGAAPFWAFDDGDVDLLARAAPQLGVDSSWRTT